MPIEIRELIIEGSLARPEDQGEESTKLLTKEDIAKIKGDVMDSIMESGGLSPGQRKELIDEVLVEVRKIMEDRWRR